MYETQPDDLKYRIRTILYSQARGNHKNSGNDKKT